MKIFLSSKKVGCVSFLFFLSLCFSGASPAFAYWLWSPEGGKFVSSDPGAPERAEKLFQQARTDQQQKKNDRAIEGFQNLINKYPTASVAPEAQYQIGFILEEKGDYKKAFEAYKKLTENYPQSERMSEVVERIFKIGNSFLSGQKEKKLVGLSVSSGVSEAAQIFEHIVKVAPYSTYGDQSQYQLGLAYKKMGQYQKAKEAFRKMIDQYSTSPLLDDAHYQLAETSYELSKRSVRDERAVDEAVENISEFLSKYPESDATAKVLELKQEISRQDAEKNYRIALYYEKEHQLESAALYYEDVAKKYPDTDYGKKAAEKLKWLRRPTEGLQAEQRDAVIELDSIGAKLKALEAERVALAGNGSNPGPSGQEKKLADEIKALQQKQELLKSTQTASIKEREQALRRDEKTWREKWKNFKLKRKEMRDNPAPELTQAFDRWEKSLTEEKERLTKERETIAALWGEVNAKQEAREKKHFRIPFFKGSERPLKKITDFRSSELAKIKRERESVSGERSKKEVELASVMSRLVELDHEGFQVARNLSPFQTLVEKEGGDLKTEQKSLENRREKLNQFIRQFEEKKTAYRNLYGDADADQWLLSSSIANLTDTDEFATSGIELEEALRQLQQDKAKISDAWMKQKELVDTLSHAFDKKGKKELAPAQNKSKTVQVPKQTKKMDRRGLRKRIKFLEREIRKRLDEIEDWNQKKKEAISELDTVLHQKSRRSVVGKITKPATFPIRFPLWLTRSLLFGLSHEDKKVVKQARRKKPGSTSDQELAKVRQLQEEIELQSLLIQGRYKEVDKMSTELIGLQTLVKQYGLEYRPILLEREFIVGKESLRSANRILSDENRKELLIQDLDRETRKLKSLQEQLNQMDRRIAQFSTDRSMKRSLDEKQVGGDKEDSNEETSSESAASGTEQAKLTSELTSLKQKIESGEKEYQTSKTSLEEVLYDFYVNKYAKVASGGGKHGGQRGMIRLTPREKEITQEKAKLDEKGKVLNNSILNLKHSEKKLILSGRDLLGKKKKLCQEELDRIKNEEESARYQALHSEFEATEAELIELTDALQVLKL